MQSDPIYLDNNGTTPVDREVLSAMLPYLESHFGNPSTKSVYGQRARAGLDQARAQVAALIGARPDEIYFTSGATEANNWVVFSGGPRIVTDLIEHPSVLKACDELERQGRAQVVRLPVDRQGRVRLEDVEAALDSSPTLVTVMHSNNEIGTLQPVAEIGKLCRARGVLFHTDAAQSLGKIAVDVNELQVDALTLAGHKLYAPKGIGALYLRQGVELRPYAFGAGQERGLRSGTENVALAVGLGAACQVAQRRLVEDHQQLRRLRDLLQGRLQTALGDAFSLNGHEELRLPNTLSVNFGGTTGAEVLAGCPELAASTGPACHDGVVRLSHVLAALGVAPDVGKGAVRLTLGRSTREEDVERAAQALVASYTRLLSGERLLA